MQPVPWTQTRNIFYAVHHSPQSSPFSLLFLTILTPPPVLISVWHLYEARSVTFLVKDVMANTLEFWAIGSV